MPQEPYRIGVEIGPYDPYWVEANEVVCHLLQRQNVTLVPLEIGESNKIYFTMDLDRLVDQLLALELDAFIFVTMPIEVIRSLTDYGIPVISLGEHTFKHPLFACLTGLYESGCLAGKFIAEKLGGQGEVLGVGGFVDVGHDKGQSRIRGFYDALANFPQISVRWLPADWDYDIAYKQVSAALRTNLEPFQAIYGLSDSMALVTRDVLIQMGRFDPATIIVGINGDALAMASIAEGRMTATIGPHAQEIGRLAVEAVMKAVQGVKPLPDFNLPSFIITRDNVAQFALPKLIATASLPTKLVGVNRNQQKNRVRQLETSSAINQRVGVILDRKQLAQEVAQLIHLHYGFDLVHVFLATNKDITLHLEGSYPADLPIALVAARQSTLLQETLRNGQVVCIPDTKISQRYPIDPLYPDTRARVLMPIRLGQNILGVLDLHSNHPVFDISQEITGLQSLSDYLGIAVRNAELYSEAVSARQQAEKADELKTRLLANVSHELRTPLNVILGYSRSAMQTPGPYNTQLPDGLLRDLQYIYQSGDHLIHIINDLLDLSRAEIGELSLFPETIDPQPFLKEVFTSFSSSVQPNPNLEWRLEIPDWLPVIVADPVRLRQIVLNLLSNAVKFTHSGHITLGAEVEPPHLHLWVQDTGPGIPIKQQEQIFEPFITFNRSTRRTDGIGLGLCITRYIVALHHGILSLESQPELGSTFHVYLPLPSLAKQLEMPLHSGDARGLFVLGTQNALPHEVERIASRQGLEIHQIDSEDALEKSMASCSPVTLVWNVDTASPADWQLVQHVHSRPQYSHLPFILYKKEGFQPETPADLTNVLIKPVHCQSLTEFIESIYERDARGMVLIVDDDAQSRTLYQQVVTQSLPDFRCLAVGNGARALEAIEKEIPSLVLLDLMMPEMDGFTVLEHLRSNRATVHLPVVVITGKKLTLEDVQRLDYARVKLHPKWLVNPEEIVDILKRSPGEKESLSQPTSRLVRTALVYLQQHSTQPITRKELADEVGVSENYLSQIFHQDLGISPWEALNRLRIEDSKERLVCTSTSITQIATQVGFNDSAYFSRVFHKLVGVSPQQYRLKQTR